MSDGVPVLLVVVLFPALFGSLWVFVLFLLSRMAGWNQLAQRFARRGSRRHGTVFSFARGAIGLVSYRSTLNVTIARDGFGLAQILPFRVFHPTLFVPWTAIEDVRAERYFFFMMTRVVVTDFNRRVFIGGKAGTALARAHAQVQT